MLFRHCDRRAASRAICTAGNSSAMSTAMMAITTNNSMSVNPVFRLFDMLVLPVINEQKKRQKL